MSDQDSSTSRPSPQPSWTRRDWLARNSAAILVASHPALWSGSNRTQNGLGAGRTNGRIKVDAELAARVASHAELMGPDQMEALAKSAVEAARTAGAKYADARLTREVQHHYEFVNRDGDITGDMETIGLGVRVLVDGYWGFSASPVWDTDEAVRLAREAVSQARVNAKGTARTAELGQYPVVTGRWSTPIGIDPFTVTIEEKQDYMEYWDGVRESGRARYSVR